METGEKRRGKEAATLSGGHLCHVCGYLYPNPHPSAKLRRSHRKHCGKTAPAPAAVEEEKALPASDREECNAVERTPLGGSAGEVDGKGEANGGAALLGSAREAGESVEAKSVAENASSNGTEVHDTISEINENVQINCMSSEHGSPDDKVINSELSKNGLVDCSNNPELVNEDNGAELPIPCTFGSQNGLSKHCSELTPATVRNSAIQEGNFDEYQDASLFLQTDSENGALPSSEFTVQTNNLNTVLSGSSITANEDEVSRELNLNDLLSGSRVGNDLEKGNSNCAGPESSVNLRAPYESYVNIGSNHTDMFKNESDKRFYHSDSVGDLDASSLQEAHSVILNTDSQSTCPKNMQGVMEDTMHASDTMYEASPRPESAETSHVQMETLIDSCTNARPNQTEFTVVHTENNPTEFSTQNWPVKDPSDVQLPVEKLCQKKICSTSGTQDNFPPTTYVDDTLNSITRDSYMDFTFPARTQCDTVEQVNVAEKNPFLQKTSGFTQEEVCNKQVHPEVPTEDQFPKSQKNAVSAMAQTSCAKNPFDLDDTRNDDLFELPTGNCYLATPSAVTRQEVESASLIVDQLTVSNQTRMAEAQHNNKSSCILSAAFGENNYPLGLKDMPVSSSAELVDISLADESSLKRPLQEDEAYTNGIPFVQYQFIPMKFHTVCTHDTSALSAGFEEYTQSKDATAEEMTALNTKTDDIEVKQADNIAAKNTCAINVEEKVTEDTAVKRNEVQCGNVEQKLSDSTKDVSAVQSMSTLEENKLTEDPKMKEMNAQVNADDLAGKWQTDDTDNMKALGCTGNFEEKMIAALGYTGNFEEMVTQATSAKDMIAAHHTEKFDENKQTNTTDGQEGNNQREEIAVTGGLFNSGRVHAPLKVLAEASAESKVNKPSAKERVLSFRRRSSKNDNSPAKLGSPRYGSDDHHWRTPAKLPRKDTDKSIKGRRQPWMSFICCHSVR